MQKKVYRARISNWIAGLYWAIIIAFVAITVSSYYFSGMDFGTSLILIATFSLVTLLIIFILRKAYRMRFTITQDRIIVSGIFRRNIIKISDIKTIQKTPIPFGFRLFGASFLGGLYYLPGIGKAWVTMGNFSDGVLITTKHNKHYVITPMNPMDFIKTVKGSKKK